MIARPKRSWATTRTDCRPDGRRQLGGHCNPEKEPGWERLQEALLAAEVAVLSAAAVVEASIVIEAAGGEAGVKELDALLDAAAIEIVP